MRETCFKILNIFISSKAKTIIILYFSIILLLLFKSYLDKKAKYQTKKFSIIRRLECRNCGFFSYYIVYVGCIHKYLLEDSIPIVDLVSFKNPYNKGNTSIKNPWEEFFHQPFNYTIEEVKKYAKNIKYQICTSWYNRPSEIYIYRQTKNIKFWHNFINKYIPIKDEIMKEVSSIMKKLFGYSKNILGVKLRGTDYNARKPGGHAKQPEVKQVIKDVKEIDEKNKYDYIFFSTEDELIKQKFIPEFGDKLKLLNSNVVIHYNYKKKKKINLNNKIYGNLDYTKNYVLNIIILSKCLDIITSKGNGPAVIFLLTDGFRYSKVYNLGLY